MSIWLFIHHHVILLNGVPVSSSDRQTEKFLKKISKQKLGCVQRKSLFLKNNRINTLSRNKQTQNPISRADSSTTTFSWYLNQIVKIHYHPIATPSIFFLSLFHVRLQQYQFSLFFNLHLMTESKSRNNQQKMKSQKKKINKNAFFFAKF
jgi:hypothetical protein